MTNFDKVSAMLMLMLDFSIKDSSSFPLLRKIEDIEKNSVVVEDIQNNRHIIQEEKLDNVDLLNAIHNPIFDNWLATEDSLEKKKQGGENLQKPKLSDLRSFTKRPVTLGYWNWSWRRK